MDNAIIILFSSIIGVGIILFVIVVMTRRMPAGLNREEYQQKWLTIEQSLTDSHASWQLAILNADKLVDAALKAKGFRGQTMGERMKSAKDSFSDRNSIWFAHKLRNQIAHEEVNTLNLKQTKQALAAFKRALRDLGAI